MKAYGTTSNPSLASDVHYGEGPWGAPTRTDKAKSKTRSSGRRLLHKAGRREGKKACEVSE